MSQLSPSGHDNNQHLRGCVARLPLGQVAVLKVVKGWVGHGVSAGVAGDGGLGVRVRRVGGGADAGAAAASVGGGGSRVLKKRGEGRKSVSRMLV